MQRGCYSNFITAVTIAYGARTKIMRIQTPDMASDCPNRRSGVRLANIGKIRESNQSFSIFLFLCPLLTHRRVSNEMRLQLDARDPLVRRRPFVRNCMFLTTPGKGMRSPRARKTSLIQSSSRETCKNSQHLFVRTRRAKGCRLFVSY